MEKITITRIKPPTPHCEFIYRVVDFRKRKNYLKYKTSVDARPYSVECEELSGGRRTKGLVVGAWFATEADEWEWVRTKGQPTIYA